MSTRYMKKVYGTNVLPDKDSENESDVESPTISNVKTKGFNVFDMLNDGLEHEDKENEEKFSADESRREDIKRKKKKKKRKKVDNVVDSKTYELEEEEEFMDEIEKTVSEVNKLLGEPIPSCSSQSPYTLQCVVQKSKEDILMVQYKHLNPYNELKRIFGSKTVQAENKGIRTRGNHLKKTYLVLPKKNWPLVGKSGLYMTIDHSMPCSGDEQYFMFEHNSSYSQVQQKFIEAVESLNSTNIEGILQSHLYHVDSLLQVAEICKLAEDLPFAAEVTEKALYSLERAFHPLFNITTGRCRLDYRKQQNRSFFITLFKHLSMVGGRACCRTSLEFCKLLLSLDPYRDPLAIVLLIDFYALRAREYEWFIEFVNLWDNARNLTQLPNITYSLALAHFHLGNEDIANELLQDALIKFPGILVPLLDKCSIQTDKKVTTHDFFNRKSSSTASPALDKLQTLYVARNFNLWKEPTILPWLKQAVHAVLERVDAKDDYVKLYEVSRNRRYRGALPRDVLRHIILSDIKDVTVSIEESNGLVLSYDPLPPLDSIDVYRTPATQRRTLGARSNFLSLFISSLFPDFNGDTALARPTD